MVAKKRSTPRRASGVKGPDAEPTFKVPSLPPAADVSAVQSAVQATQSDYPLSTVTQHTPTHSLALTHHSFYQTRQCRPPANQATTRTCIRYARTFNSQYQPVVKKDIPNGHLRIMPGPRPPSLARGTSHPAQDIGRRSCNPDCPVV
jgi:hypothetical protein